MLHLRVIREPSDGGATLGALYLNDVWQCWTLEDVIREPKDAPPMASASGEAIDSSALDAWVRSWKVKGKTAIPAGRYDLRLTASARFGRVLPEVVGVPGFIGIRIHPGNTEHDTEGCLLLGTNRTERAVIESKIALQFLMRRLTPAVQGNDPIVIEYENPPARYLRTKLQ